MDTAGEDGSCPFSGSAVPMSSGRLLHEPLWAAGGDITGVYLCPFPGRAVHKERVKAHEMLDVLLSYVQPTVGTRRVLDGSFVRRQRGDLPDVSWGLGVVLSHWRV